LVSARKFEDLAVVDGEMLSPESVTESTRPMTAPELVAYDEPPPVIDGKPGQEQWHRRAVGE
ncbi:MAG: DNA recombination protein RmuC, partial [Nocardioidaceae bacterium]|nr:DNA recombination protein RmuC [Nocardioidaceae bacterium]